jgi:hypothetical protein
MQAIKAGGRDGRPAMITVMLVQRDVYAGRAGHHMALHTQAP